MKRKKSAYWAVCCWLGLALLGYGLQPLVATRHSADSERYLLERQQFEDSEVDPVGPPETHELFYDPYEVNKRNEKKSSKKETKSP